MACPINGAQPAVPTSCGALPAAAPDHETQAEAPSNCEAQLEIPYSGGANPEAQPECSPTNGTTWPGSTACSPAQPWNIISGTTQLKSSPNDPSQPQNMNLPLWKYQTASPSHLQMLPAGPPIQSQLCWLVKVFPCWNESGKAGRGNCFLKCSGFSNNSSVRKQGCHYQCYRDREVAEDVWEKKLWCQFLHVKLASSRYLYGNVEQAMGKVGW